MRHAHIHNCNAQFLTIALNMWWLLAIARDTRAADFNTSVILEVGPYSPMASFDLISFKVNPYTGLFDRQKLSEPVTINSSFVGTGFELSGALTLPIWGPDINTALATTTSGGYSNATGVQNASADGVIVAMSGLDLGLHDFTTSITETVNCNFRALRFQVPVLSQA